MENTEKSHLLEHIQSLQKIIIQLSDDRSPEVKESVQGILELSCNVVRIAKES